MQHERTSISVEEEPHEATDINTTDCIVNLWRIVRIDIATLVVMPIDVADAPKGTVHA